MRSESIPCFLPGQSSAAEDGGHPAHEHLPPTRTRSDAEGDLRGEDDPGGLEAGHRWHHHHE